tara:strand:- start:1702 stop:2379 length:678 start_codon:yes stop_codon:yes gene_type:complete
MAKSQIITSSIANAAVDTTQLAADAVDNTILDLAGSYAFSGTVSGTGSKRLLRSVTISSNTNSVDFVHGSNGVVLDSTYSRYEITIDNAISTTEAQFNLYTSSDSGSNYDGDSQYNSVYHRHYSNGSSTGNDSAYVNDFALNHDQGTSATASRGGVTGTILVDYLGSGQRTVFNGQFFGYGQSVYQIHTNSIGSHASDSDTINGLRLKFRSGDIASGIFKIYGVV